VALAGGRWGQPRGQEGVTRVGARVQRLANLQTYSTLQLLQRPQVVPDVRDRLYGDALVHLAHLLRAEFRDPHADRELLPLGLERDGRTGGQRRVRGWEPPAGGRQAGTHHVCACEEEADRAAVDADVCEDEGICEARVASRVSLSLVIAARNGYSHLWSRRTVGRYGPSGPWKKSGSPCSA
jgi:hypothetical protein